MDLQNLLLSIEGGVATLTINRPKVLNALNGETLQELDSVLASLERNVEVGALIVTGAGEKAFVAGADISQFTSFSGADGKSFAAYGQKVFSRLEALPFPVVAAVNGFALGGGLELALACHIRLFSEKAVAGLPEVTLGIIPGYGGTQRLPRIVGQGRALELILTGKKIDAAEALRMGLANSVHAPEKLMEEANALVSVILRNGPLAVRFALEAVRTGLNMSLPDGIVLEASLFGNAAATGDKNEGATAFLEKRKPVFKGK